MFHVVLNFEHESNADETHYAAIADELLKIRAKLYDIWSEVLGDLKKYYLSECSSIHWDSKPILNYLAQQVLYLPFAL